MPTAPTKKPLQQEGPPKRCQWQCETRCPTVLWRAICMYIWYMYVMCIYKCCIWIYLYIIIHCCVCVVEHAGVRVCATSWSLPPCKFRKLGTYEATNPRAATVTLRPSTKLCSVGWFIYFPPKKNGKPWAPSFTCTIPQGSLGHFMVSPSLAHPTRGEVELLDITLIGDWPTPLKNMKVRLDHHPNISQPLEKIEFMFQTTNQHLISSFLQ